MIEKIEEDLSTGEGNISKGKETIESLQSSGNIIKELVTETNKINDKIKHVNVTRQVTMELIIMLRRKVKKIGHQE